ncbi:GntR family transcriptional regulator [Lutispora sp.]|uniref:GntR family transcriptional regulator n=1 Tax=Lutispora sp. TaxID=2828727 RepID=UPI0035624D6C
MIKYKTLKDHVYDYISAKINDGSLKPNERISENRISEDLEVSRTPVREALLQLANEGYLEKNPRRGFIVKELTLERVKRIYAIIGCLEALAASLAVDRMTDKELKEMESVIEEIDKTINDRDYNNYYKLQMKFHDIFIEVADNEELSRLLSSLKRNFIRQTYFTEKEQVDTLFKVVQDTHNEHKEIFRLFKEKNKSELERYLKEVHWNVRYAQYDSIL